MSSNNKVTIDAVKAALSPARMGTYEAAVGVTSDNDLSALKLYAWNADVSGALLAPLHVCEVVVRNAVSDVLATLYTPTWPWNRTFELSLPDPQRGYSPRQDLLSARRSARTTGKVIPELKFVFWQKMFTGRYDGRLWTPHIRRVLPNLSGSMTIAQCRQSIYDDLEQLRRLRNRIAHHEPIFTRNLFDDYQKIHNIVGYRCIETAAWLDRNQIATRVIAAKP